MKHTEIKCNQGDSQTGGRTRKALGQRVRESKGYLKIEKSIFIPLVCKLRKRNMRCWSSNLRWASFKAGDRPYGGISRGLLRAWRPCERERRESPVFPAGGD